MRANQLDKESLERHVNSLEEVKFVRLSVSRGVQEKEALVEDMKSLKKPTLSQLCVQLLGSFRESDDDLFIRVRPDLTGKKMRLSTSQEDIM